MRTNIGGLERKVRGAAGLLLLAAAFFIELRGSWEGLVGAAGAILLATAVVRYCPIKHLVARGA